MEPRANRKVKKTRRPRPVNIKSYDARACRCVHRRCLQQGLCHPTLDTGIAAFSRKVQNCLASSSYSAHPGQAARQVISMLRQVWVLYQIVGTSGLLKLMRLFFFKSSTSLPHPNIDGVRICAEILESFHVDIRVSTVFILLPRVIRTSQ